MADDLHERWRRRAMRAARSWDGIDDGELLQLVANEFGITLAMLLESGMRVLAGRDRLRGTTQASRRP